MSGYEEWRASRSESPTLGSWDAEELELEGKPGERASVATVGDGEEGAWWV